NVMGWSGGSIGWVFFVAGMLIGVVGTVAGSLFGLTLIWVQNTYKIIRLAGDVYQIDHLPMKLTWIDFGLVTSATLLISFLATLSPARRAARLDPVEVLRYERAPARSPGSRAGVSGGSRDGSRAAGCEHERQSRGKRGAHRRLGGWRGDIAPSSGRSRSSHERAGRLRRGGSLRAIRERPRQAPANGGRVHLSVLQPLGRNDRDRERDDARAPPAADHRRGARAGGGRPPGGRARRPPGAPAGRAVGRRGAAGGRRRGLGAS